MKRHRFTQPENELLVNVVRKQAPSLLPLLDRLGITLLTAEEREALREALADELVETGLKANSEPNERGLALEGLIDRLWYFSVDASA